MEIDYEGILALAEKLINSAGQREDVLTAICFLLKDEVPHYDWVGIYFADNKKQLLRLGPYAGEPTEHATIPFGKGICGQVAESQEIFVVQDVGEQDNYLACSPFVKSEIVVPIMKENKLVAQFDIDSHSPNPFTEDDQIFLGKLAAELTSIV